MKKILIITSGYLPGFKSGGPVRTISNMIDELGDEFSFNVICLDRDLGDSDAYKSINKNTWNTIGKSKVFYIKRGLSGIAMLTLLLIKNKYEIIHINSFFSFQFSIAPLIINIFLPFKSTVIIGPRGEFSEGAISLKSTKKNIFIKLAKLTKLYQSIIWHASSKYEAEDIKRIIGDKANIKLAIDIAKSENSLPIEKKLDGDLLKIVFISRISPKKNLDGAIKILSRVKKNISFNVYGPIEDSEYWNNCLKLAETLPENIKFNYFGAIHPTDVKNKISQYDLFFFPTLGENFGHVIAEALFSGLPILISDATPWRNLSEKCIGWDISLEKPELFAECIEHCHEKSLVEYDAWRIKIQEWAFKNIGNKEAIEENRKLFNNT